MSFQKPGEEVCGVTADPVRKTYWVYTNQSIYELASLNEGRDVWKIYLEQGKFDVALKYVKVSSLFLADASQLRWLSEFVDRPLHNETTSFLPKPWPTSKRVGTSRLRRLMRNARFRLTRSRSSLSTLGNGMH